MNIMNKLTLKHVKKNKARTVVTIIGIIISVAMMTAVTTGLNSVMTWMCNVEIEKTGKWHVEYKDVNAEKFTEYAKKDEVETSFMMQQLGYSKLKQSANERMPYVYVQALDKDAFSNLPLQLEEGRFPKNENEIIISRHMIDNGKIKVKVGDTVTYQFGERYVTKTSDSQLLEQNGYSMKEPLTQEKSYLNGKDALSGYDENDKEISGSANEDLRLTGKKASYKVVGIISRPSIYFEDYSAPGYSAFTMMDSKIIKSSSKVNGYAFYHTVTSKMYKELIKDAVSLGLEEPKWNLEVGEEKTINSFPDIKVNQDVLYYQGVSPDRGLNIFTTVVYAILIVIIMVGSISLIYNSFAISISERSKQLGMLSSVGATRSQKRNTVLFEALIYGIVGIPLGIIAGIVGLSVAFKVVSPMLLGAARSIQVPLTLQVSMMNIIVSTIVAIITILISAYIPAIRASRISPIEAIKQSNDIKITKKKVKTSQLTHFLFGFEGELALKNMKRNKKRYRAINFSLFISVVLFVTVSAFIYYMTGAFTGGVVTANYDVSLSVNHEDDSVYHDLENRFNEIPSIKNTTFVKNMNVYVKNVERYLSKELNSLVQSDIEAGLRAEDMGYNPNLQLYAMDDASYEKYCKKVGIKEGVIKEQNPIIIVNKLQIRKDYSIQNVTPLNLKTGDKIQLGKDPELGDDKDFKVDLTVAAATDKLPIGLVGYGESYYDGIHLVVSESTFDQIVKEMEKQTKEDISYGKNIYLNAAGEESISKDVEQVLEEKAIGTSAYQLYDVKAQDESNRQLVYAVSILAYGFITLMSLICCANMCNTISTSIQLRRSEFAMLKSVGMTPKKFHRMIMFESLLYGVKALVFGLPVSIGLSYLIYRYVTDRFEVGFMLPAYIYILAVTLVFVIVGISMFYSSRKVRKENIIEGLRSETM
ncbi:ABC transporter, ATP-binding protein [Lachnospiraceae bacterium KM106-2]|nr:ABC transporter, ATP-binding protein [Lachnospiraceae bacterium KM106-2]